MIKRLVLTLALALASTAALAQWQQDGNRFTYRDTVYNRTITVAPDWLQISGQIREDIILYDSIGHFVRDWQNLGLGDPKEEGLAYRIIYRYLTEERGWIRFGRHTIRTLKEEEAYRNWTY